MGTHLTEWLLYNTHALNLREFRTPLFLVKTRVLIMATQKLKPKPKDCVWYFCYGYFAPNPNPRSKYKVLVWEGLFLYKSTKVWFELNWIVIPCLNSLSWFKSRVWFGLNGLKLFSLNGLKLWFKRLISLSLTLSWIFVLTFKASFDISRNLWYLNLDLKILNLDLKILNFEFSWKLKQLNNSMVCKTLEQFVEVRCFIRFGLNKCFTKSHE